MLAAEVEAGEVEAGEVEAEEMEPAFVFLLWLPSSSFQVVHSAGGPDKQSQANARCPSLSHHPKDLNVL